MTTGKEGRRENSFDRRQRSAAFLENSTQGEGKTRTPIVSIDKSELSPVCKGKAFTKGGGKDIWTERARKKGD